jgi:hypothetical protein
MALLRGGVPIMLLGALSAGAVDRRLAASKELRREGPDA